MSENIGSAITGLTTFNVNTLVPSLSDNADIQEALRLYHYGAPSGSGIGEYSLSNTNPANLKNPSILQNISMKFLMKLFGAFMEFLDLEPRKLEPRTAELFCLCIK
jgi:hypothetical protein